MRWVVIEAHSHLGIAPFARNGTVWCAFRYGLSKGLFLFRPELNLKSPPIQVKFEAHLHSQPPALGTLLPVHSHFSSMAGGLPVGAGIFRCCGLLFAECLGRPSVGRWSAFWNCRPFVGSGLAWQRRALDCARGRLLLHLDKNRTHPRAFAPFPMGVLDVFQRIDCFDWNRKFAALC
jgi:hypothetical protein